MFEKASSDHAYKDVLDLSHGNLQPTVCAWRAGKFPHTKLRSSAHLRNLLELTR